MSLQIIHPPWPAQGETSLVIVLQLVDHLNPVILAEPTLLKMGPHFRDFLSEIRRTFEEN